MEGYTKGLGKDYTNSQGDPVYDVPKKEICPDYESVKVTKNGK